MKPLRFVFFTVIMCSGIMVHPLFAGQLYAARVEIGPIGGYVPSSSRPGLQGALFGGGYMAIRIWKPIWIVTEVGMVPTTSRYDQTFTVNLFFARGAVKIDLPERHQVRPYFFLGGSRMEFDPAGRVDAEEALWRWSVDGGTGIKYRFHNRLSFQLTARLAVITSKVGRFPIVSSDNTSKMSIYSFFSSGLAVHF